MKHGPAALSDVELLAILLGTGLKGMNVMELARHILNLYDGKMHKLAKASYKDLSKIKGLGPAKAIGIITAMEMGLRRRTEMVDMPVCATSQAVADIMCPLLADLTEETLWVLMLNSANRLIYKKQLGLGGTAQVVVDPKVVFKEALRHDAAKIIMVHNHPSMTLEPSQSDILVTRQVAEAGRILTIPLLDHVIVAGFNHVSLADKGYV